MGCFGEVQMNTTNGGDALNAMRDESGEVRMKKASGGGSFEDVSSKLKGYFGEVQVDTNNGHDAEDDLNTPIPFIPPKSWKSKQGTDKKHKKNFEPTADQINERKKVKGRIQCVSIILKIFERHEIIFQKFAQFLFPGNNIHLFPNWKVFNV